MQFEISVPEISETVCGWLVCSCRLLSGIEDTKCSQLQLISRLLVNTSFPSYYQACLSSMNIAPTKESDRSNQLRPLIL